MITFSEVSIVTFIYILLLCFFNIISTILLQLGANLIFLSLANVAGVFSHYPNETARRKAFLETRQCIVARMNTQRENQQQVRHLGILAQLLKKLLESQN